MKLQCLRFAEHGSDEVNLNNLTVAQIYIRKQLFPLSLSRGHPQRSYKYFCTRGSISKPINRDMYNKHI